jgi:hemolysin III
MIAERFKPMTQKRVSIFRQPFNGLSHLIGAILAVFGLGYLLFRGWGNAVREVSYALYGISLVLMFAASATYHLVDSNDRVMLFLRKLDHSAIYLLIAGTYTPICLIYLTGFWRVGLLSIVWAFGLIGIIVKLFVIRAPRWTTAGIYLVMGWLCLLAIGPIVRALPADAFIWLVAGGLFYTVGAVIYITKKLDFYPGVFGFHEVWHIFVLLGAFSHYLLIALFTA